MKRTTATQRRAAAVDKRYIDMFGPPEKIGNKIGSEAAKAPARLPSPMRRCGICGAPWAPFALPERNEPYCHPCWGETPYGQECQAARLRALAGETEDDGALRAYA